MEPRLSARWSPVHGLDMEGRLGHLPPAPRAGGPLLGLREPDARPRVGQHLLGGRGRHAGHRRVRGDRDSRPLQVPSRPEPAPLTLVAQSLVDTGVGRTRGHPVLVRKQIAKKFFGWVTYTLSKSERRTTRGPVLPLRLRPDQRPLRRRVLRARPRLRSAPASATRRATRERRSRAPTSTPRPGTYEPFFGALNSTRIPAFAQLDARVAKLRGRQRGSLEAYLDVQNVTNRQNPEEIVYSLDYSQTRYITGLPILPVARERGWRGDGPATLARLLEYVPWPGSSYRLQPDLRRPTPRRGPASPRRAGEPRRGGPGNGFSLTALYVRPDGIGRRSP